MSFLTKVERYEQSLVFLPKIRFREYTWGTQKFPELLKKNYLKYLYKFETLAPFEILPPETGCSNPSTAPNAGHIV